MLQHALDKWNHQPGYLWNVHVAWSEDGWRSQKATEASLFNGNDIIEGPGPFKRLGSFAILNQYTPCFELFDAASKNPLSEGPRVIWSARVLLWLLPHYAAALRMDGEPLRLSVGLPTAHFQADYLGYLRSIGRRASIDPTIKDNKPLLIERILTSAMIIEGATYASTSGMEKLKDYIGTAQKCIQSLESRILHEVAIDLSFNDPDFLSLGSGIGLN